MKMRFRVTINKCTTTILTLINACILYLLWSTQTRYLQSKHNIERSQNIQLHANSTPSLQNENEIIISKNLMFKIIKKDITFIFRQYENYDNDLIATIASLRNILPNSQVLILTDKFIYPVLKLNSTIRIIKLQPSFDNSVEQRNVLGHVKTKYVMFVSDSVRFQNVQVLVKMIQQLQLKSTQIVTSVVHQYNEPQKQCYNLHINVKQWTLQFINNTQRNTNRNMYNICDYIGNSKQLILIKKKLLSSLTDAFMLPFPTAFYIQTSYLKYKVKLVESSDSFIKPGKKLFTNVQNSWKYEQLGKDRWKEMCKKLGFKKVIQLDNSTDWYGCRKNTARCFGTVINGVPQYIYEGKWTPPCCLKSLRETGIRVLTELENKKLRYWLLNKSLLGAFHMNDILPWDYHIDIGVFKEDIEKSDWLMKSAISPVTDDEGFIWERINNGNLYRIQYSHVNRIYVNLYTYSPLNNTYMISNYNVTFNKFYSHFIKPFSKIKFVGYYVSAPNNIRNFLQMFFSNKIIDEPLRLLKADMATNELTNRL